MWNHNCSCNFPYSLPTSRAGITVHPASAFWDDGSGAGAGWQHWHFSSVSRKRWVQPFRNHESQCTASFRKNEITEKHSCFKTCYWSPECKDLALKSTSKKNNSVLNIITRSQVLFLMDPYRPCVNWGGAAGTPGIAKLFPSLIFCTQITNEAVSSSCINHTLTYLHVRAQVYLLISIITLSLLLWFQCKKIQYYAILC